MSNSLFYLLLICIVYVFMGFVYINTQISIYIYLIIMSIFMYFSKRIANLLHGHIMRYIKKL
ncbi:Uncharacterised protein [Moraxella lacunata]|uniref:Uncharacterized protein n=1 Tax=Moraxella lacunata TaxID=477 RepID=A0A378TQS2_MORLA|nr:Uncharacterised protein [Moraxella lacunata]